MYKNIIQNFNEYLSILKIHSNTIKNINRKILSMLHIYQHTHDKKQKFFHYKNYVYIYIDSVQKTNEEWLCSVYTLIM